MSEFQRNPEDLGVSSKKPSPKKTSKIGRFIKGAALVGSLGVGGYFAGEKGVEAGRMDISAQTSEDSNKAITEVGDVLLEPGKIIAVRFNENYKPEQVPLVDPSLINENANIPEISKQLMGKIALYESIKNNPVKEHLAEGLLAQLRWEKDHYQQALQGNLDVEKLPEYLQ